MQIQMQRSHTEAQRHREYLSSLCLCASVPLCEINPVFPFGLRAKPALSIFAASRDLVCSFWAITVDWFMA